MKRRRKRSGTVAAMPIASVEFMDIVLAIVPDDGWLDLVRVYPDGSAEKLGELDQPGTSPEDCLSLLWEAVDTAYRLLNQQERLNRFRRHNNGLLECPLDDPDPPCTPFGPHEHN